MRWTEEQALTMLPTVLDDPALVVCNRIPDEKRGTLQGVYKEMADVFDPPSGVRQRFQDRQREASESFLVFRTELLAMAEAAFPRFNEPALDSLVAERLLAMARKVGAMLSVVEEEVRTSLWVTHHLCAYEEMAGPARAVAHVAFDCGDVEERPRPPTRDAPPAEEDEGETVAALRQSPRIPREAERRPRRWAPREAGDHPRVNDDIICHRCGREGHIARECRSRMSAPGTTTRDCQPRSAAVPTQASADTSNNRPEPYTPCSPHHASHHSGAQARISADGPGLWPDTVKKWRRLARRMVAATGGTSVPPAATQPEIVASISARDTDWPTTASSITDAFVNGYVADKGAPERLLTYQGRNFSSKLLQEVYAMLGIKSGDWPVAFRHSLKYLRKAREAASAASASAQAANVRLQAKPPVADPFAVGDLAWLHCLQVQLRTSAKLHRPWQGPVTVLQQQHQHA
ncbi:unnamed protein product [Lampetra fluviatilis]